MVKARWHRIALFAGLVLLTGACRSTPLDNIWPGCVACAPAPTPVAQPVVCPPPAAIPWSVVIDERISPAVDCNPIKTQHTLVATVLDQDGNPMPGQRVEWFLTRYPEAVGDIVAVDDQYGVGAIAPISTATLGNNGNKIDNQYAVSVTNYGAEMIDAGNNHPYEGANGARLPDITVGRGQSWLTITSSREGVTDIVVYVPAIRDGTRHKAWAKKIWADYTVAWPADAVNTLPQNDHPFPVTVARSDGSGIPGQQVQAEILQDGPAAVFASTGGRVATLQTDANGTARFVLRNTAGQTGTNRIRFTAMGTFYGETCPRSHIATKRWQKVALEISCAYPNGPTAAVGKPFEKLITVTNTGDAPSGALTLEDNPGQGLSIVGGGPFPMDIGSLAPGATATRSLTLVAQAPGSYVNTVTVRATGGQATATNTCPIEIVQGKLEITKVCEPARTNAGSEVSFVVTVSNTGRGPLENVRVTDDYPEGIEPTSQDSIAIGDLAPGESRQIIFTGMADKPGTFRNTARAVAEGVPEVTASCTLEVVQCRLEMELVGPETIYFGESADFTLRVTNVGDGEADGCLVRVNTGGCLGSTVLDFQVGALAPGQTWTQDFPTRATVVGACMVSADSNCGARCQIRREVTLRVTGLPALQVEMIDLAVDGRAEGIFRVGETFIYRLTVENDAGTEPTPELNLVWRLPPELEFISGSSDRAVQVTGSGTSAQSGNFVLAVDEKLTFNVQVRVVSAPASGLVKTDALVNRASDGAELASETESTTLKP